jgi:hypothetical protein
MLPSSDLKASNLPEVESQQLIPADEDLVPSKAGPVRGSTGFKEIIDMLATESFTKPARHSLTEPDPHHNAHFTTHPAMDEGYASIVSPMSTDHMIATQPPSRNQSQSSPSYGQQRGSLHTTPDSKSGYGTPDDYHGASDISVRKSLSSATDTELFSDVEDGSDSEDEPSGFEPTEVADLLPADRGTSSNNASLGGFERTELSPKNTHGVDEDADSEDERYEPQPYNPADRQRACSYDSYPIEATSPTESQLREEGFEFHNQLPDEQLVGRFNRKAFQDAIRDVSPDMPRKQQWYSWRKVMAMLENDDIDNDDLFDDSDLPNDLSLESLADHSFGGCQCGCDSGKCTCAPGQCGCSSCPRRQQDETDKVSSVEGDEEQSVPMDIGYTPITPSFPPILHHPQPSRASNNPPSSNAGIRIPGLEPFEEEDPPMIRYPVGVPITQIQTVFNQGCTCQCGANCRCPAGNCQCDKANDIEDPYSPPETAMTFDVPTQITAPSSNGRYMWSDAATAGLSSPGSDPREPEARGTALPQIARTLTASTILSPNDAPTPAPGFRSPLPSPKREFAAAASVPSRPDTPRPTGDTFEYGIRQSVEPENMTPVAYRESTPAYENRSLSPSPISQATPPDVEMHDITPTGHLQRQDREASVLPDAPDGEPMSPPGSPDMGVAPSMATMSGALGNSDGNSQIYGIRPPPIPVSPTLKPRKQRVTSSSTPAGKRNAKSGVQGSKIAKQQPKPRSVTRKVTTKVGKAKREVTGAKVKQAVDLIEQKERGFDEEFVVLQQDGTPPRRSQRVKARSQSPCP